MKKLFIFFILISACGTEKYGYHNGFNVPTEYNQEINPDKMTPSGIKIDTSNYKVNLDIIDKRIQKIETCILKIMNENLIPPLEWLCLPDQYKNESLKRNVLIIKLVKPSFSTCSDWQFLPIPAPNELCKAKNLIPITQCPCLWRTAIQNENIILTPPPETRPNIKPTSVPAPYLWELGRMITSCNNIWSSPFSKCLFY